MVESENGEIRTREKDSYQAIYSAVIKAFAASENIDKRIALNNALSGLTGEMVYRAGKNRELMGELAEPLLSSCWPPAKDQRKADKFAREHREKERILFNRHWYPDSKPLDFPETHEMDLGQMEFYIEKAVFGIWGQGARGAFFQAFSEMCDALSPKSGDLVSEAKEISTGAPLIISANDGGVLGKDTFFGAVFRLMAAAGERQKLADRLASLAGKEVVDVVDGLPPDIAELAKHPDDEAISAYIRGLRRRGIIPSNVPKKPDDEIPKPPEIVPVDAVDAGDHLPDIADIIPGFDINASADRLEKDVLDVYGEIEGKRISRRLEISLPEGSPLKASVLIGGKGSLELEVSVEDLKISQERLFGLTREILEKINSSLTVSRPQYDRDIDGWRIFQYDSKNAILLTVIAFMDSGKIAAISGYDISPKDAQEAAAIVEYVFRDRFPVLASVAHDILEAASAEEPQIVKRGLPPPPTATFLG